MSEFPPTCGANGLECPVKAKLIEGLDRRNAVARALATELFTDFDLRIKLEASNNKANEILTNAAADCDGTDCLVLDGLTKAFLDINAF